MLVLHRDEGGEAVLHGVFWVCQRGVTVWKGISADWPREDGRGAVERWQTIVKQLKNESTNAA
jgi:hypothetical protein